MKVTEREIHYTLAVRGTDATLLDHEKLEQARLVLNARNQLLASAGAVTLKLLAEARGLNDAAMRQWVQRHRRAGHLITVDAPEGVVVPSFQLDRVLELRDDAAQAVTALKSIGMDPWATWFWMYSPNGWLDTRPVDALDDGRLPEVLAAIDNVLPDE